MKYMNIVRDKIIYTTFKVLSTAIQVLKVLIILLNASPEHFCNT